MELYSVSLGVCWEGGGQATIIFFVAVVIATVHQTNSWLLWLQTLFQQTGHDFLPTRNHSPLTVGHFTREAKQWLVT